MEPSAQPSTIANAAMNVVEAFGNVVHQAGHVAYATADTVTNVTGVAVDKVRGAAGGILGQSSGAVSENGSQNFRFLRTTSTFRRFTTILSPTVEEQGGDFGDDTADGIDPVVLRIEVVSSTEVKIMRLISWLVSLFVFSATVTMTSLKFLQPYALYENSSYFHFATILYSILLTALLYMVSLFILRAVSARRLGLAWSKRRLAMTIYVFTLLVMQTLCIALGLAATVVSAETVCGWRNNDVVIFGYLIWTLSNTSFLVLVILAHTGASYRGPIAEKPLEDGQGPHQHTSNALVLDAPLRMHLRKIGLWVTFQASLTGMLIRFETTGFIASCVPGEPTPCPVSDWTLAMIIILVVCIGLYLCSYVYYSWLADRDIRERPYAEMRFARMVFGMFREQILPVFATLSLCVILLLVVKIDSCWTYALTWVGMVPLQTILCCMVFILAYYFMPVRPASDQELLSAWLQEFSWTFAEMPLRLMQRNAKLAASKKLAAEPMFCMETAVKMLHYSVLVYYAVNDSVIKDYFIKKAGGGGSEGGALVDAKLAEEGATAVTEVKALPQQLTERAASSSSLQAKSSTSEAAQSESGGDGDPLPSKSFSKIAEVAGNPDPSVAVEDPGFVLSDSSIEEALRMYDLTNMEAIYEPKTDTCSVLAWGGTTMLLAFKGTSSMENVITDLNLWKTYHPPVRFASITRTWGFKLIKSPVRVHRGFFDAWESEGYRERVMARVGEVFAELGGPQVVTCLLTGHSLGGALATLAAHDIKTRFPAAKPTVYTFGQPRVGNRAFAYEYNELIDEHFSVINGEDPVSRVPKGYYKRVGERIVVNKFGDIIVRPTYLEMHLINTSTMKVSEHMCGAYRLSMMRIVKNQFTQRSLRTGQPGARELCRFVNLNSILTGVHMSEQDLDDPEKEPMTVEMFHTKAKQKASWKLGGSFGKLKMSCGDGISCAGCSGMRREKADHADEQEEVVTALEREKKCETFRLFND